MRMRARELWMMEESSRSRNQEKVKHTGGCHCGAVRFEVWAPATLDVIECNCSICYMKRNAHFIVPEKDFKLLKGADSLTCYMYNTHQAKHTFCRVCGVQSFYTPRSNPDGRAVTIYCIDPGTVVATTVTAYDGRNWEAAMSANPSIKDRSKP
ncbi:Centromere protein V [Geodia barretti]|uniref:Centromere protein V n=1 Tax=Geodia barretti TaxID=519541 RepID=A0AA35SSL5_GEOBA|nr:Centromere protein V [Geodia barretti]